jgi:hypothetical protein
MKLPVLACVALVVFATTLAGCSPSEEHPTPNQQAPHATVADCVLLLEETLPEFQAIDAGFTVSPSDRGQVIYNGCVNDEQRWSQHHFDNEYLPSV